MPVAVAPAPVLPVLRAEDALEAIVHERVQIGVGDRVDAAAAPAVAAVGAAARHVLLAAERRRAVTAAAGGHLDARFVEEFHRGPRSARSSCTRTTRLRGRGSTGTRHRAPRPTTAGGAR